MNVVQRAQLLRRESCLHHHRTWHSCLLGRVRSASSKGGQSAVAVGSTSSRETVLLEEVLDQLRSMNHRLGKISKQVKGLESRVCELYEYTSLPLISEHFSNDFADSVDLRSAAQVVDHILDLALNLDLPALKQRGALIDILEEYVLKDRAGLRAALKSLIDEACDEAGVCMVALPRNFQTASWDDIRACLQELQLGYSTAPSSSPVPSSTPSPGDDHRITNLMRLVDALEGGMPPRPLPGFIELATAMSGGRCLSNVSLDCRGRIDVRDTYIEFHFGAFKGVDLGYNATCQQLLRAAALFVWSYRVLEPHIYTHQAGRTARDVEAVGYTFSVGKRPPLDSVLKLYDEFTVEVAGRRSHADIAYRYFSVKPTGLHEHFAKV